MYQNQLERHLTVFYTNLNGFAVYYANIRVTSHEKLSVAEFSGEYARPKVYENGLKNVLAIWLDLELKVKNVKTQSFYN